MGGALDPAASGKVDRVLNSKRGKAALFILFLLPGTPKDAMSYALGSTMSMSEFVVLTSLARTPALLASMARMRRAVITVP
jgi:uncharacterized membrane protein YdjX (TVP38/TMEM64 family)